MAIEWKDIPGFEGKYQASSDGDIKSCERYYIDARGHHRHRPEKILKQILGRGGYLQVRLYQNEKEAITYKVHRLVATTFLLNPNNLPCINHKDENPGNNQVSNLEWSSYKHNNTWGTRLLKISDTLKGHSTSDGTREKISKKLSKAINQYSLNMEFIRQWASGCEISRETDYDQSAISCCCNGKYKQAYGYIWRFA